jgi:hypothetical protein
LKNSTDSETGYGDAWHWRFPSATD